MNYLRNKGPDCVCSLDLFDYDKRSITHYRIDREESKTSFSTGWNPEPSKKDIALMAYLHPKQCGGTIELNWRKETLRERNGRQDFKAVRKSIPRIVAGLASLFCRHNVHMSLHGEATKVDEDGLSYHYEEFNTTAISLPRNSAT